MMGTPRAGFDADLAVIGGGPIGLATAVHAVSAGLRVCVIEPRPGTLDKACGEGLMPGGLAILQGLGVDPSGIPLRGVTYVSGHRCVSAPFAGPPGRGVRRTELHSLLVARAEVTGVDQVKASMRSISQSEDGVQVTLQGARAAIRVRYVVGADGLHSRTRRQAGLEGQRRVRRRFGYRQHFAVAPWTDHVEAHWGRDSQVYCTPVTEGMVGVAVLTQERGTFADYLACFPAVRERLDGANALSVVRGAGPLHQRAHSRACGRILLVGDAGGYVDALTGEGLAIGFAQAAVAVRALCVDRPEDYPHLARGVSWRSTALTSGLLLASNSPGLRSTIVPAAQALPTAFRRVVNTLATPVLVP